MAIAVTATIIGLPLLTTAVILVVPRLSLYKATGAQHAVLRKPVSRLSDRDIFLLFLLIVLKKVQRTLGLTSALQPSADGTGFDLPALSVTSTVAISDRDLLLFDEATSPATHKSWAAGSGSGAGSSSWEPHHRNSDIRGGASNRSLLMAGLVNPLMSILLANRNLHIQPLGCVNTGNTFTFFDPEACRFPTRVLDSTRGITVSASLGGPGNQARRVKRGVEFDMYIEVTALRSGDTSPTVIFRQVGGVLAFLPRSTKPLYDDKDNDSKSSSARSAAAAAADIKEQKQKQEQGQEDEQLQWTSADGEIVELGTGAPRRWAALCRDYNPIHMSSLLARLFGFPGKIAHGNHALARAVELISRDPTRVLGGGVDGADKALALLQRTDGSDGGSGSGDKEVKEDKYETPSSLQVRFRRPILLPCRLGLEVAHLRDGFALRVVREGKEHLVAKWTKL